MDMQYLINSQRPNHILDFSGTDQEKPFRKNKKKQGANWEYADKKVLYSYNERGFRTVPFSKVAWEESIVIFGCSYVEGVGLAYNDTISSQLEKILNMPVINLGIGGSAIDLACWNSLILYKNYPRPKAVVQMWTALERYSNLRAAINNDVESHGPWTLTSSNAGTIWKERSKFYIYSDRELWRAKLPYYEITCFSETASEVNIDFFHYLDKGRDLIHFGTKTAQATALRVARNLKNQGLTK